MALHEVDDSDDEGDDDDEIKAMQYVLEAGIGVPAVAEGCANVGEDVAPGPGADKGVKVKLAARHTGNSGGQGDEGAHDGEQASDEYGDAAVLLEEALA